MYMAAFAGYVLVCAGEREFCGAVIEVDACFLCGDP